MHILGIETATDRCGVSIVSDGKVVVDLLIARPRSHAEFLAPLVEQALAYGRMRASDLGLIAVSMGPGSYTGLRIGVSTAKGLAFATGSALVGVPSLEALGLAASEYAAPGDRVLTAFSARRDEVYAALWEVEGAEGDAAGAERGARGGEGTEYIVQGSGSGRLGSPLLPVAAVPLSGLVDWIPDVQARTWICGDAAARVVGVFQKQTAKNQELFILSPVLPSAVPIAGLGREIMRRDGPADLASFEPFYLKEFVAKKQERTIFERLPF